MSGVAEERPKDRAAEKEIPVPELGEGGTPVHASGQLEFRILGPLEAYRGGRPVALGAYRQRALLAALLLRATEVVSTDRLIEDVWGESIPPSAPNMVQVYVSRLRKALGRDLLITRPPGYVVLIADAQLDATQFSELVAEAAGALADGAAARARGLLDQALGLWRGPPLADFTYESFTQGEVARLEELRLGAIELRADADLALGRHARLVGELEQLITLHPLRERLREQLMLALYRSGRQADALDAYRATRRTLIDELGIEPGPGLKRLEQAILTQDRELEAPVADPAAALPPRPTRRSGNLPQELTSLLGRESDLDRVADLFARHRLVSLVGPGGVGKTRVAQRVAANLAAGLQHGAWLVDLTAIGEGDDVAGAVMSAMGISDRPKSAALDTVVEQLRERTLLLVLDNCEHVLRSAADVAARLGSECPAVSILATSREPLAVVGERVMRLEPLSTDVDGADPPPAVALFLDRAAGHGVPWEESEEVLETIREVCERLDGIPLAIELAAARTRAISPAKLLAHLDDRLRLLVSPRDWSTHARQQTLEATIAWSYDLLSRDDRATLRRLSVFHGSFTLPAAAAVCADIGAELDTLERITGLVDRSVVCPGTCDTPGQRREDRDRYRLLESIWLFAERLLRDAGEERAARDRHARFFLESAQERSDGIDGVDSATRPQRLDADEANFAAALGWCLDGDGDPSVGAALATDLGWHWTLSGRANMAKRWLERALELRDQLAPSTLAALHIAYSGLTYSTGDLETSRSCANEAIALARELEDQDLLGAALAWLACASKGRQNRGDAVRAMAELRSLQPRLSSPRVQAMALIARAITALHTGRPAEAVRDASSARQISRDGGDHVRAAWSGAWLAYALALTSTLASARTAIGEATQDAVRSGYELAVVDNLIVVTTLALADDDLETVRRMLPRVVEMLREQQRWDDLGGRLRVAAATELKRGFPERSAILLGAAQQWNDEIDVEDEMVLPELVDLRERIAAQLGTDAFARALRRGADLSPDEIANLLD